VLSPRAAINSAGRREGALQRFDEFDGLPVPAMFSRGPVYPYEVSHRPRETPAGAYSPGSEARPLCPARPVYLELPLS
jgi:hypothetical protein